MITLVNATASTIPVAEVGVGGYFCQLIGLKPGARSRCRLRVRGDSPVLFRVGTTGGCFPVWIDAPREEVPVLVTWRSHGNVNLVLSDAGIEVKGALSERLP